MPTNAKKRPAAKERLIIRKVDRAPPISERAGYAALMAPVVQIRVHPFRLGIQSQRLAALVRIGAAVISQVEQDAPRMRFRILGL